MDYGDIIYDKLKSCITIRGTIQKTLRERLYQVLRLESLSDRCKFRKLTFFESFLKTSLAISH